MKFKLLALWMVLGSLVFGAAWEQSTSVKTLKAVVSSEKPLVVGSNTLNISLTQQNAALENAAVEVKAFMPAMPGMPAMESTNRATAQGKGVYSVPVELEMHGTWQMQIFVTTKEGKKYRLKTSLNL